MPNKLTTLFTAMAVACLTGCGTICNFANSAGDSEYQPRVYGGVLWDLEVLNGDRKMPPLGSPTDPRAAVFIAAALLVEPVATFTADTLTLPITIGIQTAHDLAAANAASKESSEGLASAAGVAPSPAPAPPVTSVAPAK